MEQGAPNSKARRGRRLLSVAAALAVLAIALGLTQLRPAVDQFLPSAVESIEATRRGVTVELDRSVVLPILERALADGWRVFDYRKGYIGADVMIRGSGSASEFQVFFVPCWLRVRLNDTSYLFLMDEHDHKVLIDHIRDVTGVPHPWENS